MTEILKSYEAGSSATLSDAFSLPFPVYHDSEVFDYEIERIFRSDWVFVCCEQELANPGEYCALNIGGEAVAVIRGRDEELRALSNCCRHRGTQILEEGFGKLDKHLVCPYHAWTYDDQGNLKGAPHTGDISIDKAKHGLPRFQIDTLMGLVFVNLSESPRPLTERFAGVSSYIGAFDIPRFNAAGESTRERWQANWKLAMENAMESYHLFKVHENTLEKVTPTKLSYYVAGSAPWTVTGGKLLDHTSAIGKWFRGDYPEALDHYLLIALPPAFVGILTYESLGFVQVLPDTPETCVIRANAIFPYSSGEEDRESVEFTAAFFAEDRQICERVQKGMTSTHGQGGKLTEMERVIVDFHQYLSAQLFATQPDGFHQTPEADRFLR